MNLFSWSSEQVKSLRNLCERLLVGENGYLANYDISSYKNTNIDEAKFVVLDTELTGLDSKRDEIISIGAIKMTGKSIHTGETLYELIKPSSELKGESIIIHGITPADLEEKPFIDEILPNIIDFCGNDIIVGFCPDIDLQFINKECEKHLNRKLSNPHIDILEIYKWLALKKPSKFITHPQSLYEIAASFDVSVRGAHNALADAYITAQVMQRVLFELEDAGVKTIEELFQVSNPTKVGDALRLSKNNSNF